MWPAYNPRRLSHVIYLRLLQWTMRTLSAPHIHADSRLQCTCTDQSRACHSGNFALLPIDIRNDNVYRLFLSKMKNEHTQTHIKKTRQETNNTREKGGKLSVVGEGGHHILTQMRRRRERIIPTIISGWQSLHRLASMITLPQRSSAWDRTCHKSCPERSSIFFFTPPITSPWRH